VSERLDEIVGGSKSFEELHEHKMCSYDENWKEYRKARNTFLGLFILYVPVCFSIGVASIKFFATFTPGFVAAFLWMGMFVVSGVRLNAWRCPNCGECFSGSWWYNLGFLARRCVHCGLPKYGNEPPAASAREE
jgi:hypothetical protein